MAVNPIALYLANPESAVTTAYIPLMAKSSLPFLASMVVLIITREPRLALPSAVAPLVVSVVYHLIAAGGPLAGSVLESLAWFNLLPVFPMAFWIGLRSLKRADQGTKRSGSSPERTHER